MAVESRVLIVGEAFTLEINNPGAIDFYQLSWGRIGIGAPTPGWYMFCEGEQLSIGEVIEHRRNNSIVQSIHPPREGIIDEFVQRGVLRE